jgi:hypothetical protein
VHTPVIPLQKLPPAQSRVAEQRAPGRPFPGSAQVPPAHTLPLGHSEGPLHGVPAIPSNPLLEHPAIATASTTATTP